MHRILFCIAAAATVFLMGAHAWALPSYKDANWGVVPQDHGNACIVVMNSEDKMHAFHFVVDGQTNAVTVGILDSFAPDRLSAGSPKITVDFGPLFVRQLQFEHRSQGSVGFLAADLSHDDLKNILAALQSGLSGVSLSFADGEVWRIPGPKQEAASAIARCWNEALGGTRVT